MKDETKELFRQLEKAKQEQNQQEIERIRNIIFEKNIGLISKMAIKDEDLKSECYMEFLNVICRFDPNRGIEFSTYATTSMIRYIKGAQRKLNNQTAIPYYKQLCINKAINSLYYELGREPSAHEIYELIYEIINITEEEITQILNASKNILSLDYQQDESDADTKLEEILASDYNIEEEIDKRYISEKIIKLLKLYLNDNQFQAIIMRYGLADYEQSTFQQIGDEIGDSKQRAKQIIERSLRKLRSAEEMQDFNPNKKNVQH